MGLLQKIKGLLLPKGGQVVETAPAEGYDLWAASYDGQPDNLMLALDEALFAELLQPLPLQGQAVVDVGCGTGRHWPKLLAQRPASLTGYDVSGGMLAQLQQKFPQATAHLLAANGQLQHTASGSCGAVVSTLTMAHIPDAAAALREWARVLQPGGHLLVTDYHPQALAKGATRSFVHGAKTVHIQNHVHTIAQLQTWAGQLNLTTLRLIEKRINDSMKPWYEKQGALPLYEQYKGTPIIYGFHWQL
jgi:ubiquinone/menaquinone biosynthesis C-methylase UbiE